MAGAQESVTVGFKDAAAALKTAQDRVGPQRARYCPSMPEGEEKAGY